MRYTINVDDRIRLKELESSCYVPTYIKFSGVVNESNASKFCEELEAAEDHCIKSKQTILPIIIDSYGGDVYAMMSMIDMIQACKVKIATIVEGKAMSCGAILFSMGAEGFRFVAPHATVMIHEVASMTLGKVEEIKASVAEADRLNDTVWKLAAKNCGHKEDYFLDLIHQKKHADWFLDAEECMKHNLANHTGIPSFHVDIKVESEFRAPTGKALTPKT